jgi:hypothetical protein
MVLGYKLNFFQSPEVELVVRLLQHAVFVKGLAPLHQGHHLLTVGWLVVVGNQAYHSCVVSQLDN